MNTFPSSPFSSPSVTSAPPPPPEVKVRTMRSDLESMAKSGGGLPRFRNVKVSGLSLGKQQEEAAGGGGEKKKGIPVALLALPGVALLALLAYLIYRVFFAR